jgi:2-hydroxychromene-2-carboxylate isomerase
LASARVWLYKTSMSQPNATNDQSVRFYFSFRSPYSWLALHRAEQALAGTGLSLEYIPVFPPPNYPNDPTAVPAKLKYIQHDIARIANAYGLTTQPLAALDCQWVRPHAAFVYAQDQDQNQSIAFAKAVFSARFSESKDVGQDAVVAECASRAGLDASAVVAAQDESSLQERVVLGMIRGVQEDDIFGVPLFCYRGERFWGNDRIEWLLRRVAEQRGQRVPDLSQTAVSPVV